MNVIGQAKSEKKLRKSTKDAEKCSITISVSAKVEAEALHFPNLGVEEPDHVFALRESGLTGLGIRRPCYIATKLVQFGFSGPQAFTFGS